MPNIVAAIRREGFRKAFCIACRLALRKGLGIDRVRFIVAERLLDEPFEDIEPGIEAAIRRATADDLERLGRVVTESKLALFRQRFEAGRLCFVALDGEKVAFFGWISLEDEYEPHTQTTIHPGDADVYLYDAHTVPEYRGNRLYPATMTAALQDLKRQGYRKAISIVFESNLAARKAMRRMGFRGRARGTLTKAFGLCRRRRRRFEGEL